MKKILVAFVIAFHALLIAREEDDIEHVKEGNLALASSQQPGPLFSFGQILIDKGDFLGLCEVAHAKSHRGTRQETAVIPVFLYGITDTITLEMGFPVVTKAIEEHKKSSGFSDVFMSLEATTYLKEYETYSQELDVVASLFLPTGSSIKEPATGLGAPGIFLGISASHLSVDWYCFASTGILWPFSHNGTKEGEDFLYQCGFGKNIAFRSEQWIITGIVEIFGTFTKHSKTNGRQDTNSGGNIIFAGPVLWFSTPYFQSEAGIAFPITQHLFGQQPKEKYVFAISMGFKFNM